jgi:hypothetical protein
MLKNKIKKNQEKNTFGGGVKPHTHPTRWRMPTTSFNNMYIVKRPNHPCQLVYYIKKKPIWKDIKAFLYKFNIFLHWRVFNPVCFCVLKVFLKKIIFFLFTSN